MNRLEVRSADEHDALTFTVTSADRGYVVAVTSGPATTTLETDLGWSALHGFFDGMAKDWRGWPGVREISARSPRERGYAPPAFRLGASTDGAGHFFLVAELAEPYLGDEPPDPSLASRHLGGPLASRAWRLRVVLVLETWQLDGIAAAASELDRADPPDLY